LFQAGISRPAKYLWVRPRAFLRVEHLKGASPSKALALLSKYETKLERFAMNKHSSLLLTSVNYFGKRFLTLDPGANVIKLFAAVSYKFFVIS
jgi:hypothetical protein